MTKALFRIVYGSRNTVDTRLDGLPEAKGEILAEAVDDILAASRLNNARDGVTGALLCSQGCFVQVLEGELAAVQETFERIQRDPRHSDVVVLEAGRIEVRLFGSWDMALARIDDPAHAAAVLEGALLHPGEQAGTDVVALLQGLLQRQADWVR